MSDHLQAWPNEEVIGVSKNDLRIQLMELTRADSFHASLRANRHEHGGFNSAVIGCQSSTPRF